MGQSIMAAGRPIYLQLSSSRFLLHPTLRKSKKANLNRVKEYKEDLGQHKTG